MKYSNLPESSLQILREKHANGCEKWAKSDKLHPTVDTYTEAYFKGAKHALSLPVMTFSEAAAVVGYLNAHESVDPEHSDRAWMAIMHGDAETAKEALALTEKTDPSSGPDPDDKTPPAASQEPADPDKEDAQ